MKKRSPKRNGRTSRVFSFQADPDVERILIHLDRSSRGEKTRQINEAIRQHLPEVARHVIAQQISELEAKLSRLPNRTKIAAARTK